MKRWKKIFQANGNKKKAGIIDKTNTVIKDKGHYIMIKGSIQQEDITFTNVYSPNTGAPRYIEQILMYLKREIESNAIIVGDFNTPLTPMDRLSKQKINKERSDFDTYQMTLLDIHRTFHPKAVDIHSSQVHMEDSPR